MPSLMLVRQAVLEELRQTHRIALYISDFFSAFNGHYYSQIAEIITEKKTSPRVGFMLQDVIESRKVRHEATVCTNRYRNF